MSKTMIVNYIMMAVGFLAVIGVDLPADQVETLLNSISDDALALFMLVSGALGAWLRKITDSPLADGVKGLLGLKDE